MNKRRKLVIVALGASALAVMVLMGYLVWTGYREAILTAKTTSRNYAAIIEARLDATLRRADANLQELAGTIPVAALSRQAGLRYARVLNAALDLRLVNFPELAGLRIFDADGDRLYSSANESTRATNITDRSYFRLLRDNPPAGLVFSEVLISRSRGRPSVVAARALRDEKGAFRGIVLATIELDYFQKLFQSLDLGTRGSIAIQRSNDFSLVVRWPMVEGTLNMQLLPTGNPAREALAHGNKTASAEFPSSADGVVRIYSFKVLDRYPFFVSVGVARDDVLAAWKARTLAVGLGGLLLTGLLIGLLYRLLRAEAALKANEELMRGTFEQAAVGIAHIAPGTYRILMVNNKFCNLLGYTQGELIGTDSRSLTPADEMPVREAEKAQVIAGRIKTSASERRLLRKDGTSLWVNCSLSLVRDAAGQPQHFISVIYDISERKKADLELRNKTELAQLMEALAREVNEAATPESALRTCLARICEYGNWTLGHVATFAQGQSAGVIEASFWHRRNSGERYEEFVRFSDSFSYNVATGRFTGLALREKRPVWIEDMSHAAGFGRNAVAAKHGLRTGLALPVIVNGTVTAFLEFFAETPRPADSELIAATESGASMLARLIERSRALDALREREHLMGLVTENVPAMIAYFDAELRCRFANAAFCEFHHLDPQDVTGMTLLEITGADTYHVISPSIDSVKQGKRVTLRRQDRTATGEIRHIEIHRVPDMSPEGAFRGYYAMVLDITERVRAEEVRAQLAAIVDTSNDAIISRSLDDKILSWNVSAERLFGYTADEAIGQSISMIFPPDRAEEIARNRMLLAQGSAVHDLETERLAKGGQRVAVSLSQSPIMDEHRVMTGVALVFRDIRRRKQAEAALRESEVRYRSVIAAIAEGVVLRDKDARIVACNASAERILGRTLDQMRGNTYFDPSWQAIRENGSPFPEIERPIPVALRTRQLQSHIVLGLRKPNGAVLWLSMNVQPLLDESGTTLSGIVSTLTDITERKQTELRQTMEHTVTRILAEAETLAEATPRIIQTICETMGWHCGARWQMDKEAGVLRCVECWGIDTPEIREFMTENLKRIVNPGLTPDRGLGRRVYNTRNPVWIADISEEQDFNRANLVNKAGLHGAFGFPLLLGGEVLGVMEFFHRDVRKPDALLLRFAESIGNQIGQFMARRQAEELIRHLAHYDELTGLANRSMFNQQLARSLAQARRHDKPLAVLFIDLDRFKNINDTLGHEAGDRVLKEVANRLRECLRESDTVGRLGGDEFVVLIEELPEPAQVTAVAQKILAAVAKPFILDLQEFHVTASIGISTYPADGEDIQSLLKSADISMYRAKEQGKNNYQHYSAQMNVHTIERLELESSLRRALERNEFLLYYQPKVDISSGRITGMEALVRWQQPGKALLPPAQFIPLAEETGLIVPIGEWVLNTACARNKSWQEQGLPPLRVAVNLSARQFAHENLLQDVARVLQETGMDPDTLEFEITESMVMHNPEHAAKLLAEIKAMGIHLSLDDFGTGYSSLSYLKRFPIDSVKIDRSFIRDIPGDADDAAITQAIIAMAHGLRLNVIAEGVETAEQLNFLRGRGCDEMQGYYFSKPLPEHEFFLLVQNDVAAGTPPVAQGMAGTGW